MFNVKVIGADAAANGGALVNLLQVSTGPSRLYNVTVFNTGPAQYIQVFDKASAPAGGAVPKLQMKVPADSQGSFDFGDGAIFSLGIVVVNSTTSGTYTAGAANCLIDSTYRLRA